MPREIPRRDAVSLGRSCTVNGHAHILGLEGLPLFFSYFLFFYYYFFGDHERPFSIHSLVFPVLDHIQQKVHPQRTMKWMVFKGSFNPNVGYACYIMHVYIYIYLMHVCIDRH